MPIDADRLIQIAAELKILDQRREGLLSELSRIAQGISGPTVVARRGPGRPPGSKNAPKASVTSTSRSPSNGRKARSGITTDIVEFLKSGGGAYTASEILDGLKLPKSKSKLTTISTTLVRLAKEGRAKKDRERGYRAA